MQKLGVNKFPFHPYFNLICIGAGVVLNMVGFYFLTSNMELNNFVHFSETRFYLFFIILNLAIVIFQLLSKKNYKISLLVFSLSVVLYGVSLGLRMLFINNLFVAFLAQALAVMATLFTVVIAELALLQTVCDSFIGESTHFVVGEADVKTIQASVSFFLIAFALIPVIILQEIPLFVMLLWEATLVLTLLVVTGANYMTLRKEAIIGKEEHILEYRSILLYLRASRKQMNEYEASRNHILDQIANFESAKEEELKEKAHFEQLEADKPALQKEIDALTLEINQYDKRGIQDRQDFAEERMKAIQKQLWENHFAKEYKEISTIIDSSKKQLETAKYELKQTEENITELKQILKEVQYELDDEAEQQDEIKMKQASLLKKKAAYQDEYDYGALEEKEAKKLFNKISKLTVKEEELSEKIVNLDVRIENLFNKEQNMKHQLQTLSKADLPDYQYAITTLTDKIEGATIQKETMEAEFDRMIEEHVEFNQLTKQLAIAKEEEQTYNELVKKQQEKQDIYDIDCLGNIAQIEQNIIGINQDIQDKIEENQQLDQRYQKVTDIINEFTKNKEQLLAKIEADMEEN